MNSLAHQPGESVADSHGAMCAKAGSSLTASSRNLHKVFRSFRIYRRGATLVDFGSCCANALSLDFGIRKSLPLARCPGASRQATRAKRVDGSVVAVVPNSPSGAVFGEPVSGYVRVPFDQVSRLLTPMFLSTTTLSATTVMRRETIHQSNAMDATLPTDWGSSTVINRDNCQRRERRA